LRGGADAACAVRDGRAVFARGAADAAALFPAPDYSLTGAPFAIDTAWDFVLAQLKTQGHFQGEGECLWDGMGHAH
jgi:hypothetical protein